MLLNFSVANFKSFKNKQTLDLEATSYKDHMDNVIKTDNRKLLKTIAIYGANASGKTNFLKAMLFMRQFILRSANNQKGDKIYFSPFVLDLDSKQEPTQFEVIFICDNVRYQYGFKVNATQVLEEWLYAYPKNKQQKWFERTFCAQKNKYEWRHFSGKLEGEVHSWKEQTLENTLFLSRAAQLNSQQLNVIFLWFKNLVMLPNWINREHTAKFCLNSETNKQEVLDFLKIADNSIVDVNVKEKTFQFDELEPIEQISITNTDSEKKGKDIKRVEAKFVHGRSDNKYLAELELYEESAGTIKLFHLASYWLEALKKGSILIIDELNRSLHSLLARFLIKCFNDKEINQNGAQLIFTCHDTFLLDTKVLRRDQVWFTEINDEGATELYSLSEFGSRKAEAIERGYLKGRYGAIPFVDEGILSK